MFNQREPGARVGSSILGFHPPKTPGFKVATEDQRYEPILMR